VSFGSRYIDSSVCSLGLALGYRVLLACPFRFDHDLGSMPFSQCLLNRATRSIYTFVKET
jgi:hypothetical protein